MFKPIRSTHPLIKIMNNSLVDLPTPSSITTLWNFGSLLGICLGIQLITGIFLAMHYANNITLAFESVVHITRDVNYGWLLRTLHANGASFFFICLYTHIGRGIYYNSFKLTQTWMMGIIIMFMLMATAFLGYVLPWGQMSFWGATVITNLVSAIPYLGNDIVQWLWGGFSVGNATLSRFFTLHFLLPFVITFMVILHLLFLHQTGSSNPLGLKINLDKISFHPFFSIKDLLGFQILFMILVTLTLIKPYYLGDPDNFIPANPMVTPVHIQPEWYFLFAYAILRSIPNKLGGVILLILSILILAILPLMNNFNIKSFYFNFMNKSMFWIYVNLVVMLTWIGARPVEDPYILLGQLLTLLYFLYFILSPSIFKFWINIMKT